MDRLRKFLLSLIASLALAAPGWAAIATPVSPGAADRAVPAATSCPTFSWAAAASARAYELVVYAVEGKAIAHEPLLRKRIPAAATSWTPGLEECFRGGASFAWAVRALPPRDGDGGFSAPLLFRTPDVPTAEEVEHALEVLRQWQASGSAAATSAASAAGPVAAGGTALPRRSVAKAGGGPSVAITGANADSTGQAWGVLGTTASSTDSSYGVLGHAMASSGSVAGVVGWSDSASGAAGAFFAPGGAMLLVGANASGEVFSVDNTGVVTGIGSGLSSVDAATLQSHPASDFATPGQIMPTVLANDGSGSGLDADTVDGQHASAFMPSGTDLWVNTTGDTMTGDLSTSGNYLWTAARTFYLNIPGSQLIAQNNTDATIAHFWSMLNGYVVTSSSTYPTTFFFGARLDLPNGAKLASVTQYAYDNSTADASFLTIVTQRALSSTSAFSVNSTTLTTSGASTAIQSSSSSLFDTVVDNSTTAYEAVIEVTLPTAASGDLRYYGLQIAYTLDGPAH